MSDPQCTTTILLFCLFLADHILIQLSLDPMGGRDILKRKGRLGLGLLSYLLPLWDLHGRRCHIHHVADIHVHIGHP